MFKKLVLVTLLFLSLTNIAFAEKAIILDGSMDDWTDKPTYRNKQQQMILSWFYDAEPMELFVMFEDKNTDFGTNELYLDIDGMQYHIQFRVTYSGVVTVTMFDPSGVRIWNTSGNWGKKNGQGSMEFYIPLKDILPTNGWGYEIKFRVLTKGFIYLPDNEWVIISTASTNPIIGTLIAILVAGILAYLFIKRKKKKMVKN